MCKYRRNIALAEIQRTENHENINNLQEQHQADERSPENFVLNVMKGFFIVLIAYTWILYLLFKLYGY